MIKVGIIEDESEIRRLLQKIIERQEGFQVVFESSTFAQSMMEFTKYKPDVVFVDIDLNGESGLECAKIMTEFSPKLKVIFATAHSEYMANAFEIYAFDYLVKPFNIERVVKTLTRIKDSFKEISMDTSAEVLLTQTEYQKEKLMIKGKELNVTKLTLEKGEVEVDGRVDSFTYSDMKPGLKGENGFLERLFK